MVQRLTVVPEDKVAALLARAAELDRQVMTLDTLRGAALEAGIGADAFEQALAEYQGQPALAHAPNKRSRFAGWLRKVTEPLLLGSLSVAFGVLAGRTEPLMALGIIAWITIAMRLAARGRETRSSVAFQVSMMLMTLGTRLGFDQTTGAHMPSDRITLMTILGIAMFLAGTWYIHHKQPQHEPEGAPTAV